MSITFPEFRVGEPARHEALSVFPLFSPSSGGAQYRLSASALADGSVNVQEVTHSGSVPEVLVENKGAARILFLEGEELVGAKQNRILNTTVLVAAHTTLKVPVSCVEQGRWGYKSHYFGSSGSHAPSMLRSSLKGSVSRSLKAGRGHRSDQGEVWKNIDCLHASHGVMSGTAAMSDMFDAYQDQIAAYRQALEYVEGALGMAVAVGDRVVSIDFFDKPSTCREVWGRFLSGVMFDALEAGETKHHTTAVEVEQFMNAARDWPWKEVKAVGEGAEYRAESNRGDHASALTFEGAVVHGSLATAME